MMTNLAFYLLRLSAVFGVLLYIGFPVRSLFNPRRTDSLGVETLLSGVAVVAAFGWYWSMFRHDGMQAAVPVLLLLNLPLFAVATCIRWRARAAFAWRSAAPALGLGVVALAVTLGLFGLHYPRYFRSQAPAPVSLGNNDVAFYSLAAQHLLHDGFNDHGRVASHDLGIASRQDVMTGTFLLLSASAAVTGQEPWQMSVPVQTLAIFLVVTCLARLLTRLTGRGELLCLSVSVVACASGTFFYSVYQVFTAHLLAVAVTLALTTVVLDLADAAGGRLAPRDLLGLVLLVGFFEVALVMTYPHMTFLTMPVVLGIGALWQMGASASLGEFFRSTGRTAAFVVGGFVAASVAMISRYLVALDITIGLGTTAAGWPLGRVRVAQMLGLSHFPDTPTNSPHDLFGSLHQFMAVASIVALTAVALGCAVLVVFRLTSPGRPRARLLALLGAGVLPFALYYVLFARYGEVYQAWKGALFFQPLAPACVLMGIWMLLGSVMPKQAATRMPAVLGVLVTLAWLGTTLAATTPWRNSFGLAVTRDLRDLATLHDRFGLDAVNIDIKGELQFWGTMWATYFIDDVIIYPLNGTYLAPSPPRSEWTLRLRNAPLEPRAIRRVVNGLFVLDRSSR